MQVAIAYDSLRGTTKAAANEMVRRFVAAGHGCEARSLEAWDASEVVEADLICVGSWTRGLFVVGQHPTPAALTFIDELKDISDKPCVVFCTYKLAAGSTLGKMASRMRAKGADVLGEFEFRGAEPTHAFDSFVRRTGLDAANGARKHPPRFLSERAETVFAPARRAFMRTTDLIRVQTPERSRSLYGVWSRVYEPSVHLDPAYQRGLERMVNLTVYSGDRVLDIGCGTGLGTLAAAKRAREVVAVDASPEMIGRLEARLKRGPKNVVLVQGAFPDALEAASLDEGASFDSVISSFMMAHIPVEERGGIYERMYEQLAPGGRLGLFTARGEVATRFATIDETVGHLETAGFSSICVRELDDVYRIVTGKR